MGRDSRFSGSKLHATPVSRTCWIPDSIAHRRNETQTGWHFSVLHLTSSLTQPMSVFHWGSLPFSRQDLLLFGSVF